MEARSLFIIAVLIVAALVKALLAALTRISAQNAQKAGPKLMLASPPTLTSATAVPMTKISAMDQGRSASDRRKAGTAWEKGRRFRLSGKSV